MPQTIPKAEDALRIDRWLWHARIVKHRRLAVELTTGGQVRVNRVKALKPSHLVKPGDVVTIGHAGRVQVLEVLGLPLRRGPAKEAALSYREITGIHFPGQTTPAA